MGNATVTRQRPEPQADPRRIRVVHSEREPKNVFHATVNRWVGSKKLFIRVEPNDFWNAMSKSTGKEDRHFEMKVREGFPEKGVSVVVSITTRGDDVPLAQVESEINRIYNGPLKRLLRRLNKGGLPVGFPVLSAADPS